MQLKWGIFNIAGRRIVDSGVFFFFWSIDSGIGETDCWCRAKSSGGAC